MRSNSQKECYLNSEIHFLYVTRKRLFCFHIQNISWFRKFHLSQMKVMLKRRRTILYLFMNMQRVATLPACPHTIDHNFIMKCIAWIIKKCNTHTRQIKRHLLCKVYKGFHNIENALLSWESVNLKKLPDHLTVIRNNYRRLGKFRIYVLNEIMIYIIKWIHSNLGNSGHSGLHKYTERHINFQHWNWITKYDHKLTVTNSGLITNQQCDIFVKLIYSYRMRHALWDNQTSNVQQGHELTYFNPSIVTVGMKLLIHSQPDANVEAVEWMSNFTPHFTGHVITYPYWDYSWTTLVKGDPTENIY